MCSPDHATGAHGHLGIQANAMSVLIHYQLRGTFVVADSPLRRFELQNARA
jgi:hypothetical protein